MLKLSEMTQGEAQHTLQVYQWIRDHYAAIASIAEHPRNDEVSAAEVQGEFHEQYTCLTSTRFMPVAISMFTDEDSLEAGEQQEPNVLLHRPLDPATWAVADHFNTLDLASVAAEFGIDGNERTWRKSGK